MTHLWLRQAERRLRWHIAGVRVAASAAALERRYRRTKLVFLVDSREAGGGLMRVVHPETMRWTWPLPED
jgi:hypothetical protein